ELRVRESVQEDTVVAALDLSDDRERLPLAETRRPVAAPPAHEDERQGIGLGLPLGVLDREEKEDGVAQSVVLVGALVEAEGLADADGARRPLLAAEPGIAGERPGEDGLQPRPARLFE